MKHRLSEFSAIPSDVIAVATSVSTFFNKDEQPETMVIKVATDPDKIPTHQLDLPVYLPPHGNYGSSSHYEMLNLFKRDPFVAVEFEGLQIHISQKGNYYGLAQSFSIAKDVKKRLEEIL